MCAVAIRNDISPQELRRRARQESDGRVAARLFAIANALEGMDCASAARLAGMDRQTLRDWVHRYNEEGIAGLSNPAAAGALAEVDSGPDGSTEGGGARRARPSGGRGGALAHCRSVPLGDGTLGRQLQRDRDAAALRLLWSLDLSHRKTRPRHPQSDDKAQHAFKKILWATDGRAPVGFGVQHPT
jgi:transposase